ncbi:MAG TPA: hypothetical protein PLH80_01620 [Spirochaetota bacterium]|nr:hypothetical protein [Spirochaetota bacterium]HOM87057.1 hypothetical protein [Spirochaetota bacterium]HOT19072.1 hypothetical protein [Spirochaetota bacterium]HPD05787.1 hypothetical protein [Spirochaetota bacterium]HPK43958.1 hypothetical protein [Spirochaetota bacterium]
MKCKKAIETFLMLDNNEFIPLLLKFHIAHCKQCYNEISQLQKAFTSMQTSSSSPSIHLEDIIMSQVMLQKRYDYTISHLNWITTGLIIFIGIATISYSDALKWMTYHFGIQLVLPLYLVLGCIIAAYISSYVATHLKKLQAIAHSIKSLL